MFGYSPEQLIELMGKKDEFYRISSGNLLVKCPFPHGSDSHGNPVYGDGTTLGIDLKTGKWQCFSRCESKGIELGSLFRRMGLPVPTIFRTALPSDYTPEPVQLKPWMFDVLCSHTSAAEEYWSGRGVSYDVIKHYSLGNDSTGTVMHVPIKNYRGQFVGWASRIGNSNLKWILQPDGVVKATLMFGAHMFDSKFAFGFESIPDVLVANSLGYNAFSTNGTHWFREMVETALLMYDTICLVPHADEGGMKWAKGAVTYLRGRCKLTGSFPPKPYKDFAETPHERIHEILDAQKIISY